MSRSFAFLYVIALAACFSSCQEDSISFEPYDQSNTIIDLKESISTQATTYNLDLNLANTLVLDDRQTVIEIPQNAFSTANGNIAEGFADISIGSYNKAYDFISQGLECNANGELINITKALSITLKQNNAALQLIGNKHITVTHTFDNATKVALNTFYSDSETWVNLSDAEAGNYPELIEYDWNAIDINYTGPSLQYTMDALGTTAAGNYRKANDQVTTPACISLAPQYNNDNTAVYIIFKNGSTVVEMTFDSASRTFCSEGYEISIGSEVHFVMFSKLDDNIYKFGTTRAVITQNHTDIIEAQTSSIQEIIDSLNSF